MFQRYRQRFLGRRNRIDLWKNQFIKDLTCYRCHPQPILRLNGVSFNNISTICIVMNLWVTMWWRSAADWAINYNNISHIIVICVPIESRRLKMPPRIIANTPKILPRKMYVADRSYHICFRTKPCRSLFDERNYKTFLQNSILLIWNVTQYRIITYLLNRTCNAEAARLAAA